MQRPPVDWRRRGCIDVIYIYIVNYPILSKKYFDGSPLETDTHRHFRTSKLSAKRCASFCKHLFFHLELYIYIYIYVYIYIYMYENITASTDHALVTRSLHAAAKSVCSSGSVLTSITPSGAFRFGTWYPNGLQAAMRNPRVCRGPFRQTR